MFSQILTGAWTWLGKPIVTSESEESTTKYGPDQQQTEQTTKRTVSKQSRVLAIAGAIAIPVAAFSLLGFAFQYWKDADARERDSKKVFLEQQAKSYFEIVDVVGQLAANDSPTSDKRKELVGRFWSLYYGALGTVESADVDQTMVWAGNLMRLQRLLDRQICQRSLLRTSLLLSHCVKRSLACSWGIRLEEPPDYSCSKSGLEAYIAQVVSDKDGFADSDSYRCAWAIFLGEIAIDPDRANKKPVIEAEKFKIASSKCEN